MKDSRSLLRISPANDIEIRMKYRSRNNCKQLQRNKKKHKLNNTNNSNICVTNGCHKLDLNRNHGTYSYNDSHSTDVVRWKRHLMGFTSKRITLYLYGVAILAFGLW